MQLGFLESGERKITFYSSGGIGQNPADPSSEIFGRDAINQVAKRARQLVYVFLLLQHGRAQGFEVALDPGLILSVGIHETMIALNFPMPSKVFPARWETKSYPYATTPAHLENPNA
jgi:hypothetical protein